MLRLDVFQKHRTVRYSVHLLKLSLKSSTTALEKNAHLFSLLNEYSWDALYYGYFKQLLY